MIKYILLFLLLSSTSTMWGQKSKSKKFSEEELPLKNEFYLGGGIHTRGFQVRVGYSFLPNPFRTMTFFASFGEIKHPKEQHLTYEGLSIVGGAPKAFIYGKRNNLFLARLGYGEI